MTPRAGLSLFELLIALALLALLTVGLGAALNIGAQLYMRTAALGSSAEEIALRTRLRLWLAEATPPGQLLPFPVGFLGEPTEMRFTTLAETPFAPDAAGLSVTVSAEDGSLRLVAETLSDDGDVIASFDLVLASEVSDLRISYFDALTEPPGWRDRWDDRARLPDLVRIEAAPGSTPPWPEFTVRPRLR